MNNIDPKRAVIFLISFTMLAIIVGCIVNRVEQTTRTREQRQQLVFSEAPQRQVQTQLKTLPAADLEPEANRRREIERQEGLERRATALKMAQELRVAQEEETRRQQQRQEMEIRKAAEERAEKGRRAAAEAAAARARFLGRYLNQGVTRTPGVKTAAILAVSEAGKWNRSIGSAVAARLTNDSIEIMPGFFKSEFVSDGMFDKTLANSAEVFRQLDLANSLDAVLLVKQTVRYAESSALENVITATMGLEVTALPIDTAINGQTWTFSASGAGFKQQDARAMAEERLLKQIANDTKMSLTSLLTN